MGVLPAQVQEIAEVTTTRVEPEFYLPTACRVSPTQSCPLSGMVPVRPDDLLANPACRARMHPVSRRHARYVLAPDCGAVQPMWLRSTSVLSPLITAPDGRPQAAR
jgi:hypothetical protein